MKALSICQPYAALILLPSTDARHKRIENRQWNYVPDWTGDFMLHVSKRKNYSENDYGIPISEMDFGAIVGVARLDGAFRMSEAGPGGVPMDAGLNWPWVPTHEHLEGRVCLVLSEIRRLPEAIPYKGRLGWFDVPNELLAGIRLEDVDTNAGWFVSGLKGGGTGAAPTTFRRRKPNW